MLPITLKNFFYGFFGNLKNIFFSLNIFWHLAAIGITSFLIISDLDWKFYNYFFDSSWKTFLFSAAAVGGLLPIILPIALYTYARSKKNYRWVLTAFALGQAAVLGSFISSLYKAFTGRAHPILSGAVTEDITRIFHFGFFRGGIFWGWPSSHTTIAFAMALALITLYPQNKKIFWLSLIYAFYIGIGVAATIHWFSDFAAGAILGAIIGRTVGKQFRKTI